MAVQLLQMLPGSGATHQLSEEDQGLASRLFVPQRPTYIEDEGGMQRKTTEGTVLDFARLAQYLPEVPRPKRGYCWASRLCPVGLPDLLFRAVWDGGAEGTTMSDRLASQILHAQEHNEVKALRGMGRMDQVQIFKGFDEAGKGIKVSVIMDMYLCDPHSGDQLPSLRVRIVPGQYDDLLVAPWDLEMLGFDAYSSDTHFLLRNCGLSVLRETEKRNVNHMRSTAVQEANPQSGVKEEFRLRRSEIIPPHQILEVQVNSVGSRSLEKGCWAKEELWFEPAPGVGEGQIHSPEGPYRVSDEGTLSILIENDSDEAVQLPEKSLMGVGRCVEEEEQVLMESMEEAHEDTLWNNNCDNDSQRGV